MYVAYPSITNAAILSARVVSNFQATPTVLSSAGGEVHLSGQVSGDSECTIASVPKVKYLPRTFSCASSLVSWPSVYLPENSATQPVSYQLTVSASPATGSNVQVSTASLSVSVSPPAPVTYVALGDSYAAGEGNPASGALPWVDHAGNPTLPDGCDRSAAAYPMIVDKWLATDASLPSMSLQFLACSGATTENLWNSGATAVGLKGPNYIEPQQLRDTGDLTNAKVVTITIGGDDLDFSDVFKHCIETIHLDCSTKNGDLWVSQLRSHITELGPILESTYQLVKADAPNASIFVVGYPNIFPSNPNALCTLRTLILPYGMKYLASFQNELSSVVSNAASVAGVTYVNPNRSSGAGSFAAHSVCSRSPFIRGVVRADATYSFHPNQAGQNALALDVEAAIESSTGSTPAS
jgi:lysophospholipase L1-like esterase